jgi:ABC-2 type transport system permease protein
MMFAVMYIVFVRFLRFGAGIPHFPVALLLAIVLWSFFQETTSQGMTSIVSRGDILRKINIPKYILIVSASASAFINLGINLGIVLIFAIINGVDLSWAGFLVVPLIIELYIFAVAVALLLAALYVKFRDLQHIWDVLMQVWYYATPIIYPLSMVILVSPLAAKIMLLSPMAQIIQDARFVLVNNNPEYTKTVWNMIHNPFIAIIPLIFVVVIATFAVFYFRKSSKQFTELI